MKKIYNIPVYQDAERLGAYLEGNMSEEELHKLELDIQNNPEMAELAKDDIFPDWDDSIETDFPGFDWTQDTPIDEIISELPDTDATGIEDDNDFEFEVIESDYPDNDEDIPHAIVDEDYPEDMEFDIDDIAD